MSNKEFKELLTLAAKAAGYRLCHFGCPFQGAFVEDDLKGRSFYWNPRDSSADAFELIVLLNIRFAGEWGGYAEALPGILEYHEEAGKDTCAAARLAILRAAAEIGRNMP